MDGGRANEAFFDLEPLGMYGQACRAGIFPRFGGGANEVRRDIIARRGLFMPRDAAAGDRDRQPAPDVRSPQTATERA